MSEPTKQTPQQDPAIPAVAKVSRRSFIGKAAVSAPVLAAFVSKPSWSISDSCINSGSLSGNLSNHSCQALARNADWWRDNVSLWNNEQIPGIGPDTLFNDLVGIPALAYHTIKDRYYKSLNADGSVEKMHKIGKNKDVTLGALLNSLTLNKKVTAPLDRSLIAAVLNILHPGIAYSGYETSEALIIDYKIARTNYMTLPNNGTFNDLHTILSGLNDNQDHV